MSVKPSISFALSLFLGLFGLFFLTSAGCQKEAPKPLSRLETLEIQVVQDEKDLADQEAKYKANRDAAEKSGDKDQVRYLDLTNKERLANEKRMLLQKQRELKKLRKEAGLAESK